jgi:hypothetical protein
MKDQVVMLLMGIVLALGGWNLTQTFALSTGQVVGQEKVDKLERQVEKLREQMDDMLKVDEEIMEQHQDLFEALRSSSQPSTYSY